MSYSNPNNHDELEKLISSNTARAIRDLEHYGYYITAQGQIISDNKEHLRLIPTEMNTLGFRVASLRTSNGWKNYCVAELVMNTFGLPAQPQQVICFHDDNPENIVIDNLYWGSLIEQRHMLRMYIRNQSTKLPEMTQQTKKPLPPHLKLANSRTISAEQYNHLLKQYHRLLIALEPFSQFIKPEPSVAEAEDDKVLIGSSLTWRDFNLAKQFWVTREDSEYIVSALSHETVHDEA